MANNEMTLNEKHLGSIFNVGGKLEYLGEGHLKKCTVSEASSFYLSLSGKGPVI